MGMIFEYFANCKKCGKYPFIGRGDVIFNADKMEISFDEIIGCPECGVKLTSKSIIDIGENGLISVVRDGYKELRQQWGEDNAYTINGGD